MEEKRCFISEELEEKIKRKFVFISYCQKSDRVFKSVEMLANYLYANDINIIYDKGGLEGGEDLENFQKLILHKNCKKVLVVCDSNYLERASKKIGGVGQEFSYIESDYNSASISKYLPVTVDKERKNILPLLMAKISLDIDDCSDILNYCSSVRVDDERKSVSFKTQLKRLCKDADELATTGDYFAALKKINMAILMQQEIRSTLLEKCKLYNLKLYIQIKGELFDDTTCQIASFLQKNMNNTNLKSETRAIGFHNCSLVNEHYGKDIEAEQCSESAYSIALKYGLEEQYTYALHLANLYYENKAYSKALNIIGEAKDLFKQKHSNLEEVSLCEYCWWIKILANECEILTEAANSISHGRKNKAWEYLTQSKDQMITILKDRRYEDTLSDDECAELYKIVSSLFKTLSEYSLHQMGSQIIEH